MPSTARAAVAETEAAAAADSAGAAASAAEAAKADDHLPVDSDTAEANAVPALQ